MMRIVFLGQSGFFIETENTTFLFDYYKGEIPEIRRDKKLMIFVSHGHYDHYKKQIFDLAGAAERVYYVLSNDIPPEEHGNAAVTYIGSNRHIEIEGVRIDTLLSTDEGVAFLVRDSEKTLFHAGDLNAWCWEEEGADYVRYMRRAYERQILKIEGMEIDAAFIPVDPRLEKQTLTGLDFFMRHTKTKTVFPMHFWDDYRVFARIKSEACTKEYREKICEITETVREFIIE